MNLYRIDRVTPSGPEPLRDILGVRLIRRWTDARAAAIDACRMQGCAYITRIRGAGETRRVAFVDSLGNVRRVSQ